MDRNTLIGMVLMLSIIVGYGWWSQPNEKERAQMEHAQDSIANLQKPPIKVELKENAVAVDTTTQAANPIAAPDSTTNTDSLVMTKRQQQFGVFAAASAGEQRFVTIENDLVKVKLASRGGRIFSVQLKKYKTFDAQPLMLFDGDTNVFSVQFPTRDNHIINTGEMFFEPSASGVVVKDGDSSSIALRLTVAEGKYIEYVYSLKGGSYLVGLHLNMVGMSDIIPANNSYLSVDWNQDLPKVEKSIENERMSSTCYFKFTDDEVDYLSEGKDEKKELTTKVKWIAFKQQFFTSILIPGQEFEKPISVETKTNNESNTVVKSMLAHFSLVYNHRSSESYPMQFYFGPNHYQTLKAMDIGLEKQIPLGWGIFGYVNKLLVIPTFNFLDGLHLNYGIIILILAILIKLVLLPLTYKAYTSQATMRVLKPELDEVHAKYPNDPMKAQQETMGIYKKAGVNPLGGCLPMVLQMPILIAMFRFFPSSIELRQQGFLWAHDLSTYDSIYDFGFKIPFYGDHVSLFVILMTISTIMYTMMNNKMMSGGNSAMQQQMKWMGYIMPIVFLGVLNNYSAGLSYYYLLANLTSFGQQYLFKFFVDEKAIHAKIQANKKKVQSGKKSGFQARLEEMAKQRGYKLPK
jgi:YidC/Oxa1 family membrane protein insertase